ncbi:MFS transporter [endosymbiont of Lamellibrachia barhami]|uniref:MFS transporter n=1 Tax=endosymbiont of Lamellibrachia barhami TaxID=205975 RepID=UPI002483E06F|nr:MFS transporter [endosymbiont of Lamellibrachia barhami]
MPYWRLSGFYLFYFASLGALLPFWGLYLKDRGFAPSEIGELMAVIMFTKLVAPNVWGWIADHTGRRMPIVRLASLMLLRRRVLDAGAGDDAVQFLLERIAAPV